MKTRKSRTKKFYNIGPWPNASWLSGLRKGVGLQGDQTMGKKFAQSLEKVAKTVAKQKNAKITSLKLNVKVQNINIKHL
jgi:hypothetical protein